MSRCGSSAFSIPMLFSKTECAPVRDLLRLRFGSGRLTEMAAIQCVPCAPVMPIRGAHVLLADTPSTTLPGTGASEYSQLTMEG